jgi:genome maintenance exonuclease 1|tara:strand:+ start:513 stop:1226 length:714 start_codon:yes stop_codon:yes gene_type:complete
MFNHVPVDIPEVSTKTIKRKRFYDTPTGFYPSITTVLGVRKEKQQGLAKWRERVGNDVANHIMRTAAGRGTAVHHMCEDFLNNKEVIQEEQKFLPWCLFSQLKPTLTKSINNIFAQECGLWSEKYRLAGRVDCIAEWNGVPSIIDFKTSRSERKDDYNFEYYMQASAYAEMFEERTGIEINQIVILVVTEDGLVQEFVKEKHEYLQPLIETIDMFTEQWEKENEELEEGPDVIGAPV